MACASATFLTGTPAGASIHVCSAQSFTSLGHGYPYSWSDDFVHDQLANGGMIKMLCVLDEHTRERQAIAVGKSLRNQGVILTLSRLMRLYGKPAYIRSGNGTEFTATAVMKWLRD